MENTANNELTFEALKNAVAGTAAAFRCRTKLQPAGGPGTKVFPPTYAGAVYAVEQRRLPDRDEPVTCVLLDSVQSQANRMEAALQQAVDDGRINIPLIEVDFSEANKTLIKPIDDRMTSLTVPHRLADAILRDSVVVEDGENKGKLFRDSSYAERWRRGSPANATPVYELCPTALIFGVWGAPEKPGGLGAKFQRMVVSEIVGVNASFGVRTSSRIDPLGIERKAGPLYRTESGGWTLDPEEALKVNGKPILFGKRKGKDVSHDPSSDKLPDEGRPSVANHGNVTPDFGKYTGNADVPDPLAPPEVELDWSLRTDGSELFNRQQVKTADRYVRQNRVAAGGVTIEYAEQSVVLSLAGLRQVRFPPHNEMWKPTDEQRERDRAARTVLAALAICSVELAAEAGMDLRSRCLLWASESRQWQLLDGPTAQTHFELGAEPAVKLLEDAIKAANDAGITWRTKAITLQPSQPLVQLVKRSQELSLFEEAEEEGEQQ